MKLEESKSEVEVSQSFEQKTFTIKVCPKAFDIFSAKLYSDIPQAIIRELSANAWDSHQAAGKEDTPFIVHLPNRLEPFLSIRDYGLGLSHEDILNLYTTYFESTKTDTNDQVGSFGLGSKSPFAYTDNFTVTSYFNGVKSIYSMFKAETGFPAVALLNKSKIDEPNGLEIQLAIRDEDFDRFIQVASFIYRHFPVQPKITGNTTIKLEKKVVLSGEDWAIYEPVEKYRYDKTVLMGCIVYPIQLHLVDQKMRNLFYSKDLLIKVPIGAIDISANREEIHYSSKTITALNDILHTIQQDIGNKTIELLNNEPSLLQAKIKAYRLLEKYDSPLQGVIKGPIYWKNDTSQMIFPIKDIISSKDINESIQSYRKRTNRKGQCYIRKNELNRLNFSRPMFFVEANEKIKNYNDRISQFLMTKEEDSQVFLLKFSSSEIRESFINKLGIIESELIPIASLPVNARSKSAPSKKRAIPIYQEAFKFDRTTISWQPFTVDLTKEYVYMTAKDGNFYDSRGYSIRTYDLSRQLTILVQLNIQIPELVALKNGYKEKVLRKVNWKPFDQFIIEQYKKLLRSNPTLRKMFILKKTRNETKINSALDKLDLSKKGIFNDFFRERVITDEKSKNKISNLGGCLGRSLHYSQLEIEEEILAEKEIWTKFEDRYPLLYKISFYYVKPGDLEAIEDYIRMVDKEKGVFKCKTESIISLPAVA